MKDLEEDCCTRIPGAGVDYLEDELEGTSRKRKLAGEVVRSDNTYFLLSGLALVRLALILPPLCPLWL